MDSSSIDGRPAKGELDHENCGNRGSAPMQRRRRSVAALASALTVAVLVTACRHDDPASEGVTYFNNAKGPLCGEGATSLSRDKTDRPSANFGCATYANMAAMVAHPPDLIAPQIMTPASSERRDQVWAKYVKGESTISRKDPEERVKIGGSN